MNLTTEIIITQEDLLDILNDYLEGKFIDYDLIDIYTRETDEERGETKRLHIHLRGTA